MIRFIAFMIFCLFVSSCSTVQKVVPTLGNGKLDVPEIDARQAILIGQVALRYALRSEATALRLIELASEAKADLHQLDDDYTVVSAAELIKEYVALRESLNVADKQLLIALADEYVNNETISVEVGDAKIALGKFIDIIMSNAELAARSQRGQLN